MKNIYLLPTDKPSRLHTYCENEIGLSSKPLNWRFGKHIYITSDEEIKEGDWFLWQGFIGGWYYQKCERTKYEGKPTKHLNCAYKIQFKIILTTDPDLIADGVQAIDDEFLYWFIKNPGCEFVETESLWVKEIASEWWSDLDLSEMEALERKNGLYGHDIGTSEDEVLAMYFEEHNLKPIPYNSVVYKIIIPQEKSEEETLEEIAENQLRKQDWDTTVTLPFNDGYIEGFQQGAKWQAERMYGEEDMSEAFFQGWFTRERFDDLSPDIVYPKGLDYEEKREYAFKHWFEQNKKK